ncbi:MAG: type VII toxin-antitoxin system HepT family RNase toxin [Euzebya sp.]
MTPRSLDPEVVQQKLRHIDRLRGDLLSLGSVDADRLAAEPITRHAGEWILTQVAQQSAAAASYLVVRLGDQVPASYRDAFRLLAEHEVVDAPLAERMQALAGMRNVLVHRYSDIDLARLAHGLNGLPEDAQAFVQQVMVELRRQLGEVPPATG